MAYSALSGIKVLDLTRYIAGPYCTRMLAGFGAEVIKIEEPLCGDPARRIGPFLNDEPGLERSGLFLYLNSSKKGITLNLKSKKGAELLREMVRDADALVENFRPGVMARLGLNYKALAKINPGLVMTSISNFGQTGPYRNYESSHLIAWGMSGGRYNDGEPGKRPVQGPGWLCHCVTGLFATAGTVTAVLQSLTTGTGQQVDVSMAEAMALIPTYTAVTQSYLGILHTNISGPREIYRCKDGWVGLHAAGLERWKSMCVLLGVPEIAENPNFQPAPMVNENRIRSRATFAPKVAEREKMELFQAAAGWQVAIAIVSTTEDILNSPQLKARRFFETVDHPVMGKVTLPGAPFRMSQTPWKPQSAAPTLGQHNEEIYCEKLGYLKDDLVRLREQSVI